MIFLERLIKNQMLAVLKTGKSVLLLGPRQTGKTTIINQLTSDKLISFANVIERQRYEKNPGLIIGEIELLADRKQSEHPLIIIDEVQKVPILMDAAQDLIDRKIAQFILTGSSARKLRRSGDVNLLPGRVIPLRMDPLLQQEIGEYIYPLESLLLDGALPEILLEQDSDKREALLLAYVSTYLEEEVRAEAIVRDLGQFSRFLELAASESGKIVNFSKLSQEIGVSHSTISGYYQILVDCLIAEMIQPIIHTKTRRKLSHANKYLFYDLGVRRLAANEGRRLPREQMGHLLEHYVGLELIRNARLLPQRYFVRYWRDLTGIEIDWVVESSEGYIPIEVKWTDAPVQADAKHLQIFLKEYDQAKQGYIICRTPNPIKISDHIIALPWQQLNTIFNSNA